MSYQVTSDFKAVGPINESDDFKKLFCDCLNQHNQSTYYSASHDLDVIKEQIRQMYLPLNHANLLLGREVNNLIKISHEQESITAVQFTALKEIILKWQRDYNAGNVFRTFKYLQELSEEALLYKLDLRKELLGSKEVTTAFVNSSFSMKCAFQFKIILNKLDINTFVSNLISSFIKDTYLFYYIRELTFSSKDSKNKDIVILKLILNHSIVTSKRNPIVSEILAVLLKLVRELTEVNSHSNNYYLPVGKNLLIAQGDNNYKRFLAYLGVLDEVYSASSNHAYLNL